MSIDRRRPARAAGGRNHRPPTRVDPERPLTSDCLPFIGPIRRRKLKVERRIESTSLAMTVIWLGLVRVPCFLYMSHLGVRK